MLIQGSAGERFGTVLRARRAGDFLLRESRYEAALHLPTHHHPRAYFCFIAGGDLRERRVRREFDYGARSLHFHPPGEPHGAVMGREGATCLSIIPLGSIAERLRTLPREAPFGATLDRVAGLADRCWAAFQADDPTSDLSLEAAALELVAATLRLPAGRGAQTPEWLRAVRDHLDRHYAEHIAMRELARVVGIHEVHLPRAFRRHFGTTPGAYVRRLRIAAARRAIADTPEPLAEIALAAGFASQAHFTRVFRREVGMPPGAWRRRYRRGH